jgi:hypothetical protein
LKSEIVEFMAANDTNQVSDISQLKAQPVNFRKEVVTFLPHHFIRVPPVQISEVAGF